MPCRCSVLYCRQRGRAFSEGGCGVVGDFLTCGFARISSPRVERFSVLVESGICRYLQEFLRSGRKEFSSIEIRCCGYFPQQ